MMAQLSLSGLEVAWGSHVGLVRRRNEDAVGVRLIPGRAGVMAVLCDGMGGHPGGDVAARIARDQLLAASPTLAPALPLPERFDALLSAFYEADERIRRTAQVLSLSGMGTTAVAAAVTTQEALHLYVGDSRLYHMRSGALQYRTRDQSVVEMIAGHSDAPFPRNLLLSSLGGGATHTQLDVVPKWGEGEQQPALRRLEPEDWLMLCSDGLHGAIGEARLLNELREGPTTSPGLLGQRLLNAALSAGGPDNISLILIRVVG